MFAFSFDTSASIRDVDYDNARNAVAEFVDLSSYHWPVNTANDNLYYFNYFSHEVTATSWSLKTNSGYQVSTALFAESRTYAQTTDLLAGLVDLNTVLNDESVTSGVAFLMTDGVCCTNDTLKQENLKAAGDDLRALGVTVVAIATSHNYDNDTLKTIASTAADGTPLVFHEDYYETLLSWPKSYNKLRNSLMEYFCPKL